MRRTHTKGRNLLGNWEHPFLNFGSLCPLSLANYPIHPSIYPPTNWTFPMYFHVPGTSLGSEVGVGGCQNINRIQCLPRILQLRIRNHNCLLNTYVIARLYAKCFISHLLLPTILWEGCHRSERGWVTCSGWTLKFTQCFPENPEDF